MPLYRLLGGERTDSVRCYATGFYWSGDAPLEEKFEKEARGYLADGFEDFGNGVVFDHVVEAVAAQQNAIAVDEGEGRHGRRP